MAEVEELHQAISDVSVLSKDRKQIKTLLSYTVLIVSLELCRSSLRIITDVAHARNSVNAS